MVLEKGISTTYENVKHHVKRIRPKKDEARVKTKLRRQHLIQLLFNKGIADLDLDQEQQTAIKAYLKTNKPVQDIIDRVTTFRIVLASHSPEALTDWIHAMENTEYKQLKIFTKTIKKDLDAVRNAVTLSVSNGIAEGKINKLKVIKRMMYGRSSFATLKQKIFLAEYST